MYCWTTGLTHKNQKLTLLNRSTMMKEVPNLVSFGRRSPRPPLSLEHRQSLLVVLDELDALVDLCDRGLGPG